MNPCLPTSEPEKSVAGSEIWQQQVSAFLTLLRAAELQVVLLNEEELAREREGDLIAFTMPRIVKL